MPSFDVVSEIDKQEVDNAVNQARKEIETRYDFRNTNTEINLEKETILLNSADDYKVKAVQDVLLSKMVKRGVDPKALDFGKIEPAANSRAKAAVQLRQGISQEIGKKINKFIKDAKLKVQSQLQDNQVRVIGKKRDDLQEVIAQLKAQDFGIPLQYKNFRD